jgi:cbb3-type cytochrome oxidase maturation protein
LLKYVSVLLAAFILLAAVPVCAQAPSVQIFDVPSGGYSGTDTLILGDIWNEYVVEVPKGHELVYSFQVIGNGSIRVLLVNELGTQLIINAQLNYYIEFSTSEPVSSYSATFPPNFSLGYDYTILVANTTEAEVSYSASISINEIDAPDYTIYYVLIVLGLVGLVVFSWILVNKQEDDKKRIAQEARDSRKSRKGKRRR